MLRRFFALYRASGDGPVGTESGASWGELQQNAIFDAYSAHYDRERELFEGESSGEQP